MDGDDGEGLRLSKRFSDKNADGEVDYKTKPGTAWSHSYLNQKPWHPLSYPNQRRKWIAEQTNAHRERRAEEVAREYAQEQEFFRQTALISKKEKEKVEMMKAVSFMYVRPPGYNAESAKVAEIADERKKEDGNPSEYLPGTSAEIPQASMAAINQPDQEKKKSRAKDVFGRALPTEEEFEVLKNAPRMETGAPGRAKPFAVEVRNVKCVRCDVFGHQSGDRECPLKDVIMPNEESRLKRDDPLTAILAHTDPSEPLKWELKQKPGISPPRGGFKPDDPNQQIIGEEDIFDEYGGFLSGDNIPELLTKFSGIPKKKPSKKKRHKKQRSSPSGRELKNLEEDGMSSPSEDEQRKLKTKKKKDKMKRGNDSQSRSLDISEYDMHHIRARHKHTYSSADSDSDANYRTAKRRNDEFDLERNHGGNKRRSKHSYSSADSDIEAQQGSKSSRRKQYHSTLKDSKPRKAF